MVRLFKMVPTVRGIDVPAKTFRTPASTERTATAFTRAMCATHAQDTAPEMKWQGGGYSCVCAPKVQVHCRDLHTAH